MNTIIGITAVLAALVVPIANGASVSRPTIPIYDTAAMTKACDDDLARAASMVAELEKVRIAPAAGSDVLARWDRINIAIEDADGPSGLFANVSPDEKARDAADACQLKLTRFNTELLQNERLYEHVRASRPAGAAATKLRKNVLEAFEDTGVALPAEKRARMKAIIDRLEEIRQEFGRNIRNNKTRLSFTADEVKGLPPDYLQKAQRDSQGNYLLGFEYPEYIPFMANAENEDARRRYQFAFANRGTPRNLELLAEAMRLRKEMAGLFGMQSFAEFATRRRMVENPQTVDKFLSDVKDAVRDVERREIAELTAFKADLISKPVGEVRLNRWDVDFYQDKLKKARYDVDQEALRKYFPTEASLRWVMAITGTLYGVKFVPAQVPVWHDDVRYFDVVDVKSGRFIGGVYIDPFPRPNKYSHAAAFPARGTSRLAKRTPISVLVSNFNRTGLDHDELETLVHEFGHVMHGVLSGTDFDSQAGTSVERDFVEAPSQMYEEWARRKESLSLLRQYCSPACPPVDDDLLRRLSAARLYGAGIRYSRQHLYAAYDMVTSSTEIGDPLALWNRMEGDTPLGHVAGTQFPGAFEHIIGGYTAGYYGYMWSEVLALDMLSVYGDNLMNPAVGHRFRETVLSRGSSRRGAQMVRDFLGREPSSDAFIAEITGTRSSAMQVR